MKRYRLSLAYQGTEFSGWGVQPDQRTVQGVLGEACRTLFKEVGELSAAGRTDLKLRYNGGSEVAVVEIKIWGRNDGSNVIM